VAFALRPSPNAGGAEAALNALLDDEASKLRIVDYLRKVARRQVEEMPAVSSTQLAMAGASLSAQNLTTTRNSRHWQLAVKEVNPLSLICWQQ
jgi:hypothetical protein